MARIYKAHQVRGGVVRWGIDYEEPMTGRRIRRVVGNQAQARSELVRVLGEIDAGTYAKAEGRTATLRELRAAWLEHRSAKRSLHSDKHRWVWILKYFGEDCRLAKISGTDVVRFRNWLLAQKTRRKKPMGPAATNRILSLLRAAFNLAIRPLKLIRENPVLDVDFLVEHARDRVCSDAEEERLLEHAPAKVALAIVLAVDSGMRAGEIASLEWRQVDLEERSILLTRTKTNRPRRVALSPRAVEALKRWPKSVSGKVLGIQSGGLTTQFSELTRDLGIHDLRFHDLRHTCATRLRRAKVDLVTIKKILGHESWQMVERYQTVDLDDQHSALAATRGKRPRPRKAKANADS